MRRSTAGFACVAAALALALAMTLGGCATSRGQADQGPVWGFVASAKNARLVVDPRKSTLLAVHLSEVVAPETAWVCVYEDAGGAPGKMVGQVRVGRGVTSNVEIPLDPLKSGKVFVLMHADRGIPNVFEFDEQQKEDSPDRPIFVDGSELAVPVTLGPYGVKVASGRARIEVYRQGSIGATLTVGTISAPGDSWVVIQSQQKGRPGKVIGLARVPAGRFADLDVPLAPDPSQGNLYATLFADSGTAGKFEFDPESPQSSADQPYYVDGVPVRAEVPVTRN
jgi:hypothetical protein